MDIIDINVKLRDGGTGKHAAHNTRMQGLIPAVVYAKGIETLHVAVDRTAFVQTFTDSSKRLFNLKGLGKDVRALLRDAQYDPMGDHVIHLDFQRVVEEEVVSVRVPLEYRGEPKGVKAGGRFKRAARNIHIACKPGDIPSAVQVRVDDLDTGQRMSADKLELGPNIKLLDNPNLTICSVKKKALVKKAAVEEVATIPAAGAAGKAGAAAKPGAAAPAAGAAGAKAEEKKDDKKKK